MGRPLFETVSTAGSTVGSCGRPKLDSSEPEVRRRPRSAFLRWHAYFELVALFAAGALLPVHSIGAQSVTWLARAPGNVTATSVATATNGPTGLAAVTIRTLGNATTFTAMTPPMDPCSADPQRSGCTWATQTSAADHAWSSVTYGNGLFVAVSAEGVMTSPDGITWTTRQSAANHGWSSVTYGNGLFVAVSAEGVMTSSDGIDWTERSAAAASGWSSVTYGNGRFVAVAQYGSGSRVMTSPDGIEWTSQAQACGSSWSSVTHGLVDGNDLFVAVANTTSSCRVMTSQDGIIWTHRSGGQVIPQPTSVTYGKGLFVAVSNSPSSATLAMTSPDGITWTPRSTPSPRSPWQSVTYGDGLFVAVASDTDRPQVMTSPDGSNWTGRLSSTLNRWSSVTFGTGMFVAVSFTGTGNRVMTSGMLLGAPSKLAITTQPTSTVLGSMINPAIRVQVQDAGGIGMTESTVAVTLEITQGTGTSEAVLLGTTTVSAVGGVATFSDLSIDRIGTGYTLTATASGLAGATSSAFDVTAPTPASIEVVAGDNQTASVNTAVAIVPRVRVLNANGNPVSGVSVTFAVGSGGGSVTGSTVTTNALGIAAVGSWTLGSAEGVNTLTATVTESSPEIGTVFTANAWPPDPCSNETYPGCTWVRRTPAADLMWGEVTYGVVNGSGLFVAVARTPQGNRVMTSPDGVTWTARTPAASNLWSSVTHGVVDGEGLFVAVAEWVGSGDQQLRVMTSRDGINWTLQRASSDNAWGSVTYGMVDGSGLFVAVASSGFGARVMTSPDGIDWTPRTAFDSHWTSVTHGVVDGRGLFVAVGDNGSVMTSPDGINWTFEMRAVANTIWKSVTHGNGVFVAVGSGCRFFTDCADRVSQVMTSADGVNWTARTSAADNDWRSVAYGDGLFVAVAGAGGIGNQVMTSPDGIHWTTRTAAASKIWQTVAYGNGVFVALTAINGTGNEVMTSGVFTIGAPSKLAITTQPTSTVLGSMINPAIRVQVQDAGGIGMTGSTVAVTLEITQGTGTSEAVLLGTTTVSAVGGVATFSDLSIDRIGTGYTLTATASGLAGATSSAFDVDPDVCSVPDEVWGDVNDDNRVSIIDAQQIARYSVQLSVANPAAVAARGDVNADGAVTIIDAQQIARFSVGLSAASRINTPVSAPPTVASIMLTPAGMQSVLLGGTLDLTATARNEAGVNVSFCAQVTWTTSNAGVASVTGDGRVTGVGVGSSTITATSGGQSASVTITVWAP
jgi:hypothetical protein